MCEGCVFLAEMAEVKTFKGDSMKAEIRVGSSVFEANLSGEGVKGYFIGGDGWYAREDGNGWRDVTTVLMQQAEGGEEKRRFHWSKVSRNGKRSNDIWVMFGAIFEVTPWLFEWLYRILKNPFWSVLVHAL